jgi:hypothetical protein
MVQTIAMDGFFLSVLFLTKVSFQNFGILAKIWGSHKIVWEVFIVGIFAL